MKLTKASNFIHDEHLSFENMIVIIFSLKNTGKQVTLAFEALGASYI